MIKDNYIIDREEILYRQKMHIKTILKTATKNKKLKTKNGL